MILLTLLCVSTSKITAQNNDSLKISATQVKNVYTGLKQGEAYKIRYENCLQASIRLDSIIQDQAKRNSVFASKLNASDAEYKRLYDILVDKSVEYEKIKNKKIPWYLHPFTYFALGFATGIVIQSTP